MIPTCFPTGSRAASRQIFCVATTSLPDVCDLLFATTIVKFKLILEYIFRYCSRKDRIENEKINICIVAGLIR